MLITLLSLFAGSTGILVIYYTIFGKLAFTDNSLRQGKPAPVSVIIRSKNNAAILRQTLPAILAQDHPDFEVILINDASSDHTMEVMEYFSERHDHVKIVNVINNEAFWGKKKYALTLGIKAARHPIFVFTEDNYIPLSGMWLQEMSQHFCGEKSMVLGYSKVKRKKNVFANALIRFDNWFHAIKYLSFAKSGMPYTGSGKNLAYHKNAFYQVNGFISHMNMKNGEDELFINEVATAKNTAICVARAARTESVTTPSFRQWVIQKREGFYLFRNFKIRHRILLNTYYMAQFLFWLLPIPLVFLGMNPVTLLTLILIKWGIQYAVMARLAKRFDEKGLMWLLPIYEFVLISVQFYIFITGFRKSTRWK
ncbi:Glycosyltransferase, catalytic subunit of cellulose synthase and poly-beta-1,6-N-acetylglucosamine synthase [Sinomicrobium oceani]|uniref:Glycosyltransferase, catalytic subunit of cellulose synthase and poly-beta-1,6-N-acetylglucosamine synthase n=1 Tax=Sinomicrobium oceani TaxID=1150368 RepID=A0A1K1RNS4_9FLAO|nr:glycosyltransferase [Sinomicrobium oceani]SFW73678.1 Glycosyltransferase, catalytic subunit of cellulose synthase and poly-beta-1,6-N-acetylglucosamine synthase [Sinomicrobium oceani]